MLAISKKVSSMQVQADVQEPQNEPLQLQLKSQTWLCRLADALSRQSDAASHLEQRLCAVAAAKSAQIGMPRRVQGLFVCSGLKILAVGLQLFNLSLQT